MKRMICGITMLAVTLLLSAAAQAQRPRNFVSGVGSDTNPCTRAEPCKTLAQAISVTNSGGEVIVLDSAEYGPGPITIGQGISITAPDGVDAQITSTSGNAITITASSGIVALSGLNLVGAGGTTGIAINSGTVSLTFFNGSIIGFTNAGIAETVENAGQLWVQNSLISNGNGFGVDETGTGINADGPLTVKTVAVSKCQTGIASDGTFAAITDSFIFANGIGIENGPSATVVISNNLIDTDATGVTVNSTDGGVINSPGDNLFYHNGTDVSGSLTPISKQ